GRAEVTEAGAASVQVAYAWRRPNQKSTKDGLLQTLPDRVEQFVARVQTLFPVHDAAQMVRLDEGRLGGDGLRVVVADETAGSRIPQPRCPRSGIPVAHIALLADVIGLQLRPWQDALEVVVALVEAAVRRLHAGEFATVERRADHQLARGTPAAMNWRTARLVLRASAGASFDACS